MHGRMVAILLLLAVVAAGCERPSQPAPASSTPAPELPRTDVAIVEDEVTNDGHRTFFAAGAHCSQGGFENETFVVQRFDERLDLAHMGLVMVRFASPDGSLGGGNKEPIVYHVAPNGTGAVPSAVSGGPALIQFGYGVGGFTNLTSGNFTYALDNVTIHESLRVTDLGKIPVRVVQGFCV